MWPAIIGAIGGLATSLTDNIFNTSNQNKNNKFQAQLAQMNNQWNSREAEKARDFQQYMYEHQEDFAREMFNRTNEYNTAEKQRERLEAAGLNPYMMMGGGSAGSATSTSAGSAPGSAQSAPAQMPNTQALRIDTSGVADAINSYFQNRKIASETTKNDQINSLGPDYYRSQMASAINGRWEYLSPDYKKLRMSEAPNLALNDMSTLRANLQGLQANTELTIAQGTMTNLAADEKRIMNAYLPQQQQADLYIKSAQLYNMYKTGLLTEQQVITEIRKQAQLDADTQGKKLANNLAERLAESTFNSMEATNNYNASYYNELQRYARNLAIGKNALTAYETRMASMNYHHMRRFYPEKDDGYGTIVGKDILRYINSVVGNVGSVISKFKH